MEDLKIKDQKPIRFCDLEASSLDLYSKFRELWGSDWYVLLPVIVSVGAASGSREVDGIPE